MQHNHSFYESLIIYGGLIFGGSLIIIGLLMIIVGFFKRSKKKEIMKEIVKEKDRMNGKSITAGKW